MFSCSPNQLLLPPEKLKKQIGFQVKEPKPKYSSREKFLEFPSVYVIKKND